MGLTELNSYYYTTQEGQERNDNITEFHGKVIGVDAPAWMHKIMTAPSTKSDFAEAFHALPPVALRSMIRGWTKRAIEYFLALGIRNLVFYFDGCRDPMKAEEDKLRPG